VKPLIMDGSVTVSDINTAERAVEREMLMEMVSLKRGLAILATVGSTAPFADSSTVLASSTPSRHGLIGRRRHHGVAAGISRRHRDRFVMSSGVWLQHSTKSQPFGEMTTRPDDLSHQGCLG
jgi:hypothetical protein